MKIFNINILFVCMLVTYGIFIYLLYDKIHKKNSISKIIQENRELIFVIMLIMGFFTILYEYKKYQKLSISIITLLIGIYGVTLLDENIYHYCFADLVAISIFFFMYEHCLYKKKNIYWLFFYMTIICFIGCIIDMNKNITYWEAGFIGLFALFYIILHFYN